MTVQSTVSLALLLATALACKNSDTKEPASAETPTTAADTEVKDAVEPAKLLPNGKRVGDYLVGGQPSDEQLAQIASLGYKTVINLRRPAEPGSESAETIEALHMSYVAIPIGGEDDLTADNARKLDEALKAAKGPTVIHCASGNRVGVLFGLRASVVDGRSTDEALAVAKEHGATGMLPVLEKILKR